MQQQRRHPAHLGGQLQAPGRRETHLAHLAQHDGRAATPQAFLHGPQKVLIAARLSNDQAPGVEAELGQAGAVQMARIEHGARTQAPQHHAFFSSKMISPGKAGRQRRGEPHRGLTPHDLVQAVPRQAAPGQGGIQRRRAERDRPSPLPIIEAAMALNRADLDP